MISIWTHHLKDPNEKVQFEKSLLHSRWILERLEEILKNKELGLDVQERSPKAYDSPNWDYRQAHANGFRQCLNYIQMLINLDHKEQNDRIISDRSDPSV